MPRTLVAAIAASAAIAGCGGTPIKPSDNCGTWLKSPRDAKRAYVAAQHLGTVGITRFDRYCRDEQRYHFRSLSLFRIVQMSRQGPAK